jgi:ribosome-binding protein aMBF1 (putative translation factor)
MPVGQLVIAGRRFMVVEESEYSRLLAACSGAAAVPESKLPPLPQADAHGQVPALEYARSSLARRLIIERRSRGWSQAELARRAGVRVETINRLEKAKHTADPSTIKRIEAAIEAHPVRSHRTRKTG